MSHGQTKFNASWLSQKDDMSINVGEWCKADYQKVTYFSDFFYFKKVLHV